MSTAPQRRWYQFSLKAMMTTITVACIATGSTIGCRGHRHYCLEQADYHRVNARWHKLELRRLEDETGFSFGTGKNPDSLPFPEKHDKLLELEKSLNLYRYKALLKKVEGHRAGIIEENSTAVFFDNALWHPWLIWSADAPPTFVPKSE